MITERNVETKKKAEPNDPAFSLLKLDTDLFLNNFFLPYPASPTRPDPRRSMVAGSGTGSSLEERSHP